jgi:hypothetical protein
MTNKSFTSNRCVQERVSEEISLDSTRTIEESFVDLSNSRSRCLHVLSNIRTETIDIDIVRRRSLQRINNIDAYR